MIRVSVACGEGKLTVEVATLREARKFETTFGTSCRLIKEANSIYEKDGDRFEYLSRVQFAMGLCSPDCARTLTKLVKYGD